MRYLFQMRFDGSEFNGWQRQENTSNTIQENVEISLGKLLGNDISIVSCGRTDKGVHAKQFYFHLDISRPFDEKLLYKLNRILPESIHVIDYKKVEDNFHARFSAVSRTYHYYFHTLKNPFLDKYSTLIDGPLEPSSIVEALEYLSGQNDFRNFCKTPDKHDSTICKIIGVPSFTSLDENRWMLSVSANRFLKSMMRILAFRLLEVGNGKISVSEFRNYFAQSNKKGIQKLSPNGLYLVDVKYNSEKIQD